MIKNHRLSFYCLIFLGLGCGPVDQNMDQNKPLVAEELANLNSNELLQYIINSKKIDIIYLLDEQYKRISIENKEQINDLIKTIKIESNKINVHSDIMPICMIEFSTKNACVTASFIKADKLDVDNWGQIYLATGDFCRKITEIIDKKENKKVDIFKNRVKE